MKGSPVSAVSASPTASGSVLDPVRALQHALYRAAKADPGRRFHALRDKVFRRDVLWRAWVMVYRNQGAPGIDKTTLADVEQYGVTRVVGRVGRRTAGRAVSAVADASGVHPEAGHDRTTPVIDSRRPGPDRAGGVQDRARADLRSRLYAVLVRVSAQAGG